MRDTAAIRQKILSFWNDYETGKIETGEARTHIGFARTILDSLKVDIAAAHLAQAHIPSVVIEEPASKVNGRKRLA